MWSKSTRNRSLKAGSAQSCPVSATAQCFFLLHLLSKLEDPEKGGGRAAIVLSGSPLFNGSAGQGESEIRRHLLENDVVEAIIALPQEIFFRTGIGTYIWILSNKKPEHRKGKVQLINATEMYEPLRKSEGNKRRKISDDQIREIVAMYSDCEPSKQSLIMDAQDFGYRRIKVLRPLRKKIVISDEGFEKLAEEKAWAKRSEEQQSAWTDLLREEMNSEHDWHWVESFAKDAAKKDTALGKLDAALIKSLRAAFGVRDPELKPVIDKKGKVTPDDDMTDFENVPLATDIQDYLATEVLPHAEDAYIDETYKDEADEGVGIVGYEINFNRYFYEYQPPRDLEEIDAELNAVEERIAAMLAEVTE
ncbi:HsdM family class I SAM-dependent methyltransferase [Sulfitobacter sp. M22]|uniref:HsdM family class I SAM-dependent methyltransferase n=1 Tax=Sulfitobacter sp. M22 TaxID=2675332 RepID=UPI001F27AF45|nr:N-6 DNA methylase [Sulfitobacter sp. M22]